MKAITVMRAAAWTGTAVAGWSLNIVWGDEAALGNGPPGQWERHVVAAMLLSFVAAIALSVSGRGARPPGWIARGVALAAGAGAVAITLLLRRDALAQGYAHLLRGPGWTWLGVGSALVFGAASASVSLRGQPAPTAAQRSRRRRGNR